MDQAAADDIMSRILVEEMDAAADADLVIECVAENMAVKKELLAKLDAMCKDSTIFATNTSSLSITEMAQGLKAPPGGHALLQSRACYEAGGSDCRRQYPPLSWWSGPRTCPWRSARLPWWSMRLPAFVVNKILIPYCNEGVCVLQEGVASAEDIDIAMQLGCNHPMGPLHLGDLIGWDVVLNIMDVLFNETHDSKYRANVMIRKMVRAGKLGMKSGEGIFNYKK